MANSSNIADEITKALKDYTSEVSEGLEQSKLEVANETVKILKRDSPKSNRKSTKKYGKGWARKKVSTAQVIYNRNKPSLTHLLEKGHAKRGGGRVPGNPHIKPAEKQAIEKYVKKVEKVIKG
ncbi:HK97 gp10 family phage protein [Ornithinibacillus xuwenensis]|uniref:HK97 gp10 family phage protein n=1 Tax=Ornithinibacillus xuwenensis TaxID=3144668 RepID=A0ABU9XBP5_9BACI